MTVTLPCGPRCGSVSIPSSKSVAHRLLILAALSAAPTTLRCDGLSNDILATVECLRALGAAITINGDALRVRPITAVPEGELLLPCGESGSTLRFLLPVVGLLGATAVFDRRGRLSERPLAPFDDELRAHGMTIIPDGALLRCAGKLRGGKWTLPGDISSQYISALLMALPHLRESSTLSITGAIESAGYIALTERALALASLPFEKESPAHYRLPGAQAGQLPAELRVEGDWSNAAFFLCLGALSARGVRVRGMDERSAQGDKAVLDVLSAFGADIQVEADGTLFVRRRRLCGTTIDAAPIPDLIPTLAVVAALSEGETRIENAARLRLKESDRLSTTAALLRSLGGEVRELPDGLVIRGKAALCGGTVESFNDHRIAMAAAVAASGASGPVTVLGSECVGKSYPRFWDDYAALEVMTHE